MGPVDEPVTEVLEELMGKKEYLSMISVSAKEQV
jgi:hypothetical protein